MLQYQSFVLCDEVRREDNGKLLLIGVYSDAIHVGRLPLVLPRLSVVIKARAMKVGDYRFSLLITDPQGNQILNLNGGIKYEGEAGETIWLPVMAATQLTTEGRYEVKIGLGEGPIQHECFKVMIIRPATVQLDTAAPPN